MESTILIVLFSLSLICDIVDLVCRSRENRKVCKYLKKLTTDDGCKIDITSMVRAMREIEDITRSSKLKE